MATNYNYFGNLVTSGLVLDLDAAKLASYPGTGTTWFDISGNNLTGSLVNGPTFTGIGKSASIVFDGTNDYVNISRPPQIITSGSLTISLWTKWTTIGTTTSTIQALVDNNHSNSPLQGFVIQDRPDLSKKLTFSVSPNGNGVTSSFQVGNGSWCHIIGTYENGISKLYINGSLDGSFNEPNMATVQPNVSLGRWEYGGGRQLSGSIANVQLYNRGISPFEVWQNFNALKGRYGIPDIVTNGLVLNLDAGNPFSYLSGSSGTTWTNTVAVSSSISGTLVNGTSYSNGSMVFDGTNDYVDCSLLSNLFSNTSQNLTYSFWIKPTSISTIRILFNVFTTGFNGGRVFTLINTAGTYSIQAALYISASPSNRAETACNIPNIMGTWANFSIVWDGSNYAIYMNGSELTYSSRTTLSSSATGLGNSPVRIGADNNLFNPTFLGNISNTQIYNRVLSAAEITQNFNALRGRYGI